MKRKDMDPTVLYAIERSHHNPRPGYVLDPGTPPGKVKAHVYWSWPDCWTEDDGYLTTDVERIRSGKFDACEVTTAQVLMPWAEHVAEVKARQQAKRDQRAAEDADKEAKRQADIARVDAVLPLLDGLDWAPGELRWAADKSYMWDRRWNANDVLNVIEHITRK